MAIDSAKKALEELSFSMSIDHGFAWTWHCNVAMVAIDAGAPHKEANELAVDFMRRTFGVDTSKPPIEPESSNVGLERMVKEAGIHNVGACEDCGLTLPPTTQVCGTGGSDRA